MARTQANRGLIVQLELVERERALKVALEPALAVDLAAGIGVMEDLEAATAGGLHAVERDIGVFQELIRTLAVLGRAHDSNAGADRDGVA